MAKFNGPLSCLVADDESDICEIIIDYLDSLNVFKFLIPASDGISARTKITNQNFDILIVDINMPKLNGIELISALLHEKKIPPDQILIISGDVKSQHIEKLTELGVKNFLVKPFDRDGFLSKIKKIIGI